MNMVMAALFFNIFCIIAFSIIYYKLSPSHFINPNTKSELSYLDCFFYSTTIQSTIGLENITTTTKFGTYIVLLQQWSVLTSGAVLLHHFHNKK